MGHHKRLHSVLQRGTSQAFSSQQYEHSCFLSTDASRPEIKSQAKNHSKYKHKSVRLLDRIHTLLDRDREKQDIFSRMETRGHMCQNME